MSSWSKRGSPYCNQVRAIVLHEKNSTDLGDGSGKHDNFVEFTNTLHELVHAWPLDDINIVVCPFNLDWNGEVCLMEDLNRELMDVPLYESLSFGDNYLETAVY